MKHRAQALLALLAVIAAIVAAFASSAGAATPNQKIAALQKQVGTLTKLVVAQNKQVTALNKQVKALKTLEGQDFAALAALDVCGVAITTDALAGTWNVIDQISAATQAGKTYFGTQPVLSDSGACTAFQINRSQAVPPTLAAYQALLALFQAPRMALAAFAPYAR